MAKKNKGTRETRFIKYSIRRVKRWFTLVVWLFLLFLLIMGLIWVVPKVWNWAVG